MKTGITGGIGSGKSFVCKLLADMGIEVYDCDAAAKRLIHTSPQIRQGLTALVGRHTYLPDGSLNKAAVAEFLLASPANAAAVNAIVHPAVAQDFRLSGAKWMECAIMYESGFDRLVDQVVAVTAPEELRVRRVMERDNITAEKVREWMARQMPQEEVAARAGHIIVNDGTADLKQQINELIIKLK